MTEEEKDTGVVVQKGVPIPRTKGGKWGRLLMKMKVGDSFMVDTNSTRCTIMQAAARTGLVVVTRKIAPCGWRVWRMK